MEIIFLPLMVTIAPLLLIFLFLRYWVRNRQLSILAKAGVSLSCIILGMLASIGATLISVNGIAEMGIQCATGAVAFFGLGVMLYCFCVPFVLIVYWSARRKH